MKPYIVFVGTQSVGKTTVVKRLLPILTQMYGEEIKYISEVARSIQAKGFKINKDCDSVSQRLIENEYARLEDIFFNNVKVADRSIIDRFSYTLKNKEDEEKAKLVEWYHQNVNKVCNRYSHIFHIPLTDRLPLKLDGIRSADIDYRKEIDQLQKDIIKTYSVKVYTLNGDTSERIETIRKVLREEKNATVLRDSYKVSDDSR